MQQGKIDLVFDVLRVDRLSIATFTLFFLGCVVGLSQGKLVKEKGIVPIAHLSPDLSYVIKKSLFSKVIKIVSEPDIGLQQRSFRPV